MNTDYKEIEELLVAYLSNDLSVDERQIVESWRQESPENEKTFQEMRFGWEALPLLEEMEQFNSFEALKKVNNRLDKKERNPLLIYIQRAAAVLILPVLVYAGFLTKSNFSLKHLANSQPVMQTITSRQGTISQISLNDGTKVWLNSGSTLEFPIQFTGKKREVKLNGEAFFEVVKNENQPFLLNAQELNIEVLGTSFNVVSYKEESMTEVVLVTGKVKLFTATDQKENNLGIMSPGQRTVFTRNTQKIATQLVDADKYTAWRNGDLIFSDDSMAEVVKRLSRWYNVEIQIIDPELNDYIYTAKFSDETLEQVLALLKISAPISYQIEDRKLLSNGEFTKQKVFLIKKKKK